MNSRDAIQQELTDLGSSLPLSEPPVFTVPEGYFETFAASVLALLKDRQALNATEELQELSPLLAAISKHIPYHVPENYFPNLATGLPALVNEEALPEFLQTHTKQTPYAVPSGYFDGLAAQVAAKLEKPQAKVISMPSRAVRYAAAAAIAGVMAVTGLVYFGGTRNGLDPAKQPQAWVTQNLKNIPKSDIEAFLKTVDADSNSKELVQSGNKPEVRSLLHDVSTNELDAFLKDVPADAESNIN